MDIEKEEIVKDPNIYDFWDKWREAKCLEIISYLSINILIGFP